MFASVLVADRGEIAVRIIATLRRLGIRAIAVYSDADAGAPHVRLADEAVRLGPAPAERSYLDLERVLAAVRSSGAEALHPGYGFLSERADVARSCPVAWIGPPAAAIELLADKVAAKRLAAQAGVPTVPGIDRPGLSDEEILAWAGAEPGRLPIVVKAAAGGGGRGMRVVRALDELPEALGAARREALAGFGDDALLAERCVEPARHVEIQFLADAHGGVVHLGERECSLQRRHQKLVEECPSPAVSDVLRARMGEAAVALARAAGYVGAGTCEFLLPADDPGAFRFLEVNARLQVEHPVTELVYGLDLVEAQLRIAAGEPLWLEQAGLAAQGHAIEARVCAEDAERGFLPRTGRIVAYREPPGADVGLGEQPPQEGRVRRRTEDRQLAERAVEAVERLRALRRVGDHLCQQRVVVRRDLAARPHAAGDPDPGAARFAVGDDPARPRQEAALGVLGADARLDRVALR
ncbi:MAG TPA: biotin carboxylase N-terminal domain-containing protein, partial [Solirubrobacteraceae bacterium]|nr:biotin carboxylase N-terminal domain-containing protein [Solirubrobacteraceae bacterium]